MAVILFRKIPVLIKISPQVEEPFFFLRVKQVIEKEKNFLSPVVIEKFLEKLLHRVRILCLKTENRTNNLLEKLQRHSRNQKDGSSDNYWQELKKIKSQKSKIKKSTGPVQR